jgi:hypothetical protein
MKIFPQKASKKLYKSESGRFENKDPDPIKTVVHRGDRLFMAESVAMAVYLLFSIGVPCIPQNYSFESHNIIESAILRH